MIKVLKLTGLKMNVKVLTTERNSELGSDSFDGSIEDGDIVILMKMWRII